MDTPAERAHNNLVWLAPVFSLAVNMATGPGGSGDPNPSSERPGFSISFAFEPRIGAYTAVDPTLRDYGFAPVESPWLLTYGLRGRVWTPRGWVFGGAMTYGFRRHEAADNPVPTTMTAMDMTVTAGHQLGAGFDVTLDAGFGSYVMSVGSTAQGGALVYLGPIVTPRLGYVLPTGGGFVRLVLGYTALFPIGAAHQQVLWGDDFRQLPVHGLVVGVESGFALGVPRWRWRNKGAAR